MKKIKFIFLILSFFLLSGCLKEILSDYKNPKITGSYPQSGTRVVPEETGTLAFWVTFSESMDSQITEKSFTINPPIRGLINWRNGNKRLVFTPYPGEITPHTQYTMTITKGAEDKEGNDLNKNYSVTFNYVGFISDGLALTNVAFTPNPNTSGTPVVYNNGIYVGVDKNTVITLTFSSPIRAESIFDGISINGGNFTKEVNNNMVTLTAYDELPQKEYSISINNLLTDINGRKIVKDEDIKFIVGDDFTKPMVTYVAMRESGAIPPPATDITNNTISDIFWVDNTAEQRKPDFIIEFSKNMDQANFKNILVNSDPFQGISFTIDWTQPPTGVGSVCRAEIILDKSLIHGKYYNFALTQDLKDVNNNTLYEDKNYTIRMGLDLTPLRITDFTIQGEISIYNDVDANGVAELYTKNYVTTLLNRRPVIQITFNDFVHREKFGNLSISGLNRSDYNLVYNIVGAGNQITITFNKDLTWHEYYDIKFTNQIMSATADASLIEKNAMEEKEFTLKIGNDVTVPEVTANGFIITGADSVPVNLQKSTLSLVLTNNIEKSSTFAITFTESIDIDSEWLESYLKDYEGSELSYSISESGNTYTLTLKEGSELKSSEQYYFEVTSELKDIQGNSIQEVDRGYYPFLVNHENSSAVEVVNNFHCVNASGNVCIDYGVGWEDFIDNSALTIIQDPPYSGYYVYNNKIIVHFNKVLETHALDEKIMVESYGSNDAVVIPPGKIIVSVEGDGYTSIRIDRMEGFANGAQYAILFKSGESGIKDVYGNYMKEDFKINFKK